MDGGFGDFATIQFHRLLQREEIRAAPLVFLSGSAEALGDLGLCPRWGPSQEEAQSFLRSLGDDVLQSEY
jgi:hypothetical protein